MKTWFQTFSAVLLAILVGGGAVLWLGLRQREKINQWEIEAQNGARWIGNSFAVLEQKLEQENQVAVYKELGHVENAVNTTTGLLETRPLGAKGHSELKEMIHKAKTLIDEVKKSEKIATP